MFTYDIIIVMCPHPIALFPDTPVVSQLDCPHSPSYQGTGGGVLANRSEPAGSKLGSLWSDDGGIIGYRGAYDDAMVDFSGNQVRREYGEVLSTSQVPKKIVAKSMADERWGAEELTTI